MNSAAVIIFGVYVILILFIQSVFGQDCNEELDEYFPVATSYNYPTPTYVPSISFRKLNDPNLGQPNEDDNDTPSFGPRILPTSSLEDFMTSLGFGRLDQTPLPYSHYYTNPWPFFSSHRPYTDSSMAPTVVNEDNHPNWKYFDRETCGESLADRIIGGTQASMGQYPWLALIGFKNDTNPKSQIFFSCGGALINSCWIVTAAHCVMDLPSMYYVSTIRLGEYNLKTKQDCNSEECAEPVQDFTPKHIIWHERFNNPKLKNDIALIKLNYPARMSRWVQPICLPYGSILSDKLQDKIGEVAGWGIENIETLKTSSILQTIKLPVRSLDTCRRVYKVKAHIDNKQYCVGGTVGFDSCNGDSGGPFMKVSVADGGTPRYFLYGVVSFGAAKCGKKPTPGVYTRVAKYVNWILDRVTEC